jgi:hypothetical protein
MEAARDPRYASNRHMKSLNLGDLGLTTDRWSRVIDLESLTEKIETGLSAGIFHVFVSLSRVRTKSVN